MKEENKIILYQDDNEITRVSVRFAEEDLWLTQNQLAEIYCTTKQNISQHVENILNDEELDETRTVKKFLTVRQEGNRQVQRNIDHYNLDMIIALDFAEFQALEMNPMTMKDWIEALDNQIIAHKRKVLLGKGIVSHKQAIEKAEKEFEIYRKREMQLLESDFDKAIKSLKEK